MLHGKRVALIALEVLCGGWLILPTAVQAQDPKAPSQEIPEHPLPGKALPPGFVTPDPPFEERIVWDEETPGEADFIPQAVFDRYDLDDLPLSTNQRERLEVSIRLGKPLEEPPPNAWWKPMPECSWFQHARGSSPRADALSYADLILDQDSAFVGEVVAIIPGWHTTLDRVTNVVYYRIEKVLRDRKNRLENGLIVAIHSRRLGGTLRIGDAKICTYGLKDFRGETVGSRWLLLGEMNDGSEMYGARLALPIEDDLILPQPAPQLKDRSPIELGRLEAELQEDGK